MPFLRSPAHICVVHTCLAFSSPVVICDKTHNAAEDYLVFAPCNSTLPRMFVWWGKWRATHRLAVFLFVNLQAQMSFAPPSAWCPLRKTLCVLAGNRCLSNLLIPLLPNGSLLYACNRRCGLKSSRHAETMQDKHGIMSGCAGKVCLIDQKQCLCGFKSALRFLTVSNAYFSTCYTCYQFLTHLSVIITINSITTYLTKRPAHYCIIFDMTNVSLMRLRVLQSYL